MAAKFTIPIVGAFFLLLAFFRFARDRGRLQPASKTWFLIGAIFSAIGVWLWLQ